MVKSALKGSPGSGPEWTGALDSKHSLQAAVLGERHERQLAAPRSKPHGATART